MCDLVKSKIFSKFNYMENGIDYAASRLLELFADMLKNTETYTVDDFVNKRKQIVAEAKTIDAVNHNNAINELIDWLENDYKSIVSNVDIIRKAKELRDKN